MRLSRLIFSSSSSWDSDAWDKGLDSSHKILVQNSQKGHVWTTPGASQLLRIWKGCKLVPLKVLLGVQTHTSTLHVLAEFGRCPLKIAWQAQAAKISYRLESMDDNRTLKQAFVAHRRLPKQKSWSFQLGRKEDLLIPGSQQGGSDGNSVWMGQCDISAMTSCQGRLQYIYRPHAGPWPKGAAS